MDTVVALKESGGPTIDDRRSRGSLRHQAHVAWMVWCGFVVATVGHAVGVFGPFLYPIVVLASSLVAFLGLRRFRPAQRWPWRVLIGVGVLWSIAGGLRDVTSATGDLSSSRSLLPDLFALPGYVMFGLALFGLVRASREVSDRGLFIDAVLVAVGSVSVVFATVISPTLELAGASLTARVAVAVYPAISMWMLIAVVQLTLSRRRRAKGYVLVVAGSVCLLVGDVVFALGEIGTLHLSRNVLDVPYLLVAACLGAAAWHPGVHRVLPASSFDESQFNVMRLFAVGVALVAPVVAMAASSDVGSGRSVQLVLLALVAVLAVWRIAVTARSENGARAELFHRATHDQLTGLPSRALLLEHATRLLDNPRRRPVAVMFLDLDEFKLINDSLGHSAGDVLLIEVAERLVATVREGDVVGRLGGDEFVVVTIDLDAEGAHALGDRIRRAMRAPFLLGLDEVFVSTSIGITMAEAGTSATTLMQQADTAMYRAKDHGRNHVTMFDASMRESLVRRIELEQGLRRALECNEVSVVYQPIVDTAACRVSGLEALIRWTTPEMSYSPDEFMDVAEDSGLIVSLGAFVLDEACRQAAYWRRTIPEAADLTMSVNISARQVQTSSLVDTVAETLARHDLPGEALWLEITESIMIEDTLTTAAVMTGLRRLGVRLAVDDFGTGFSALNYLRTFPVSCVKIDRSFITDLTSQPAAEALVRAVVGIGRSMQLDVIAEGVETTDQAQRLADLGCNRIQGFLFARPAPSDEIPMLLETIETTMFTLTPKRRGNLRCRH